MPFGDTGPMDPSVVSVIVSRNFNVKENMESQIFRYQVAEETGLVRDETCKTQRFSIDRPC